MQKTSEENNRKNNLKSGCRKQPKKQPEKTTRKNNPKSGCRKQVQKTSAENKLIIKKNKGMKEKFVKRESGIRREYFSLCSFEEQNSNLYQVAKALNCTEDQALEYLKEGEIEVAFDEELNAVSWCIRP